MGTLFAGRAIHLEIVIYHLIFLKEKCQEASWHLLPSAFLEVVVSQVQGWGAACSLNGLVHRDQRGRAGRTILPVQGSPPNCRGDPSPRKGRGLEWGRHFAFLCPHQTQGVAAWCTCPGQRWSWTGTQAMLAPQPSSQLPPNSLQRKHTQIPAAGTKMMDRKAGQDVATYGWEGRECGGQRVWGVFHAH